MAAIKPFAITLLALLFARDAFAATSASKHLDRPDEWYKTAEAKRIADAFLSYQTSRGDWPKNVDTATQPYAVKPHDLRGTFDNGATTGELRFLARMAASAGDERYVNAFLRGLDHILEAQYANGGWPQHYPPGEGYHR